jgi:cell pole-organizing protein PopZ
MAQAAKAQEPSMEEILASIRRIISDDDGAKPAPAPPPMTVVPAASTVPPSPAAAPSASNAAEPVVACEPAPVKQDDIEAVLAGFGSPAEASAPEPEPSASTAEAPDVLELTAAMEAYAETAAPPFRTIEASSDGVFAEAGPRPEPVRTRLREPSPGRPQAQEVEGRPLLSHDATAAVTAAFGTLAHTVLTQNARTLDDLVQEMLRPMLKSWLDDNLPTIVERMVRAEIERVSRGRA